VTLNRKVLNMIGQDGSPGNVAQISNEGNPQKSDHNGYFKEPKDEFQLEVNRDRHRFQITKILLFLFISEIAAFVGFYWAYLILDAFVYIPPDAGDTQVHDRRIYDAMNSAISIVFGPTAALVGSATGFYFGTRNRNLNSSQDGNKTSKTATSA
jgi:hypothetical protein